MAGNNKSSEKDGKRSVIKLEQLDAELPIRDIFAREIFDCGREPDCGDRSAGGRGNRRQGISSVRSRNKYGRKWGLKRRNSGTDRKKLLRS